MQRSVFPGRSLTLLAAGLAASLVAAPSAHAGKRHTVWAYPPGAGPRGAVEAETWITTKQESKHSGTEAEYRLEIENGLSDGLSLDVYLGVLTQEPGESVKFDRVQASLRADLLRSRVTAVDLTGYFELKRDVDLGNPWEFEAILIGGKQYGNFEWDVNLVYESELSGNAFKKSARELKGIVGAGWSFSPRVYAGAELVAEDDTGTKELSLGPTVSVGLTDRTWVAVGAQFGVNDDADRLAVRAIFGIFF
jgi:hypothetical protein